MTFVEARPREGVEGSEGVERPEVIRAIVRAVEARVTIARSEVERLVVHELARFRGARVTQYVPLLVERAVLRRLRVPPAS